MAKTKTIRIRTDLHQEIKVLASKDGKKLEAQTESLLLWGIAYLKTRRGKK